MDTFRQNKHIVIALDSCRQLVSMLYLAHSSNFVCELIFRRSGLGL